MPNPVVLRRCGLICLFLLLAPAMAQASGSGASVLSFAEHLRERGEYYRSISEYERFLFHHPQHGQAPEALAGIVRAYMGGGQLDDAQQQMARLQQRAPQASLMPGLAFDLAHLLFENQRYDEARAQLEICRSLQPGCLDDQRRRALLSAIYLALGEEDAALELDERQNGGMLELEIPRKDPAIAGTLSAILPGAGQLYADRPVDAGIALLVNLLFIGSTLTAIDNDNHFLAGTVGFFGIGWYGGNVYNARNSAHKFNRRMRHQAAQRWYRDHRSGGLQLHITF